MTHADPWDEVSRLEEQLDAELLTQPAAPRPTEPNAVHLTHPQRIFTGLAGARVAHDSSFAADGLSLSQVSFVSGRPRLLYDPAHDPRHRSREIFYSYFFIFFLLGTVAVVATGAVALLLVF